MAFWFAANLVLLAVSLIGTYYLRPDVEGMKWQAFEFPRTEEGAAVPLAYGTVRIDSPVLVMFTRGGGGAITQDGIVTGHYHSVQARLLLARTNARVEEAQQMQAQLQQFFIGDLRAGLDGPDAAGSDSLGNISFEIDSESGSEGEGSTHGYVVFYDGRWDGEVHLKETFAGTPDLGVAYRGYINILLVDWVVEAARLAPYSAVIFSPCVIPGHEAATGALGLGDCNPAAVIYDLLTNPWGGVGNDEAIIDVDSFVEVAETLADEQHGCSLVVDRPHEARRVIEEILRQIDGVLYQDMDAGKYVLRLIREDYVVADLPEFTASNTLEAPEMPSTLWSETYNEVKVNYNAREHNHRPKTVVAQDQAGIQINGGRVRSIELTFPGCRNSTLANKLANRELNFLARPIYTIRMVVNRQAWNLKPGDAFKFTWSDWGVTIVFRVTQIDMGAFDDGRISISAVQDRFSTVGQIFDPTLADEVNVPVATPDPIIHRLVTEAPRFIQRQANNLGILNNVDAQRGLYVGVPEGTDSRYKVDASIDGDTEAPDAPARSFPVYFTTALSYARTTAPYDTVAGLEVTIGNEDDSFSSATAVQIAGGRNLIVLFDDENHHEIVAFEAAADNGGGSFTLENVWRGLLDTVPRDWPAGTYGAVLPGSSGTSALGRKVFPYDIDVITHMPAAAGSTWTPNAYSPEDELTSRSRVLLPARGTNLLLNSSRTPSMLTEGGVTFSWLDRNATSGVVIRGDDIVESFEAGQTYDAVGYKGHPDDATQVVIASGHTSHTTQLGVGIVGHGTLDLGVDTKRSITLPDGTTAAGARGWAVPTFEIECPTWRNHLLNGRFAGSGAGGTTSWTTSGTPSVSSTNTLGSTGFHVQGGTGNPITLTQIVDVSGYVTKNLTAVLDFYVAKFTDAIATDDTITVTLTNLTSSSVVISTSTYGPVVPPSGSTVWSRQTLTIADMGTTTAKLRVVITLTPVGGGDNAPNVGCTELALRLGHVSSELLTNPSFESGLGSWTETAGTWQVLALTVYEQGGYARPNDGASAQLQQVISLPTGFELGAAVMEFARMNDAVDDTGEVVLEALDVGSNVVADETTGAEVILPINQWQRRRLVIDPIPATATQLRVTVNATRVTGTPLNACFDDFNLRCHKHLDADQTIEAEWSESVAQPLPRSTMEWKFRLPAVDPPDYALYDGTMNGKLGIEPPMTSTDLTQAMVGAKAVSWDGTSRTTTAFECFYGGGAYIETNPVGTAFANFNSATSFTVVAFVKARAGAELNDGFGICGRMADGVGWELRMEDTTGYAQARVTGAGGAATVTGTVNCGDGGLHGIALIYRGTAEGVDPSLLQLVDAAGLDDASTAAIGELGGDAGKFRIGWASENEPASFDGQILRVYIWREALDPADIDAILTYKNHDPSELITTDSRTGSIAVVTGSDSAGVLVETFGPGRTAIGYDATSDRYGLVVMPDMPNLLDGATITTAGTVALAAAADPAGFVQAIRISGDNAEGRRYEFDAGTAGVRHVQWMARAATAHNAIVDLFDAVDGSLDATTYAVTTEWQVFTWACTWDDAVSTTARLWFRGSHDGTDREIYLSPVISFTEAEPWPGHFPIGDPGPTAPRLDVSALTVQVNGEGEVDVEAAILNRDATVAELSNGTNDNDRRTIRWNAAGTPTIDTDHCDSGGVANTSAQIADASTMDPELPLTYRLRWNRAGVRDATTTYTSVRAEQEGETTLTDSGRGASWTASATPVDQLDVGHEDGASVAGGLVFGVTVRAREELLP